ncbi:MAG: hypothetical protein WCF84_03510 [Anaerolineae bacterium]
MTSGVASGDMATTKGRIVAGLQRLATFQHPDGLFSIWCGGTPTLDITARVAHRLMGLRGLPFSQAGGMLEQARDTLLQARHLDNALLALDKQFGQEMQTPEDAIAYYFVGNGMRDKALALLHKTAVNQGERLYWQAQSAWGGNLEVTADGARVMYDAGDPLFRSAFTFVTSKLVNGMLYSTADTRALVELLSTLKFSAAKQAIVDGRAVDLGEVTIGKEVTAQSANLIVRVDEPIEIDHLEPRADFPFEVEPTQTRLSLGERIQIKVTPRDQSIAPIARLFLPGNLALLKGGANAQTAHIPIERQELVVDAVAIRPGRGKLYVAVHDMYDAGKVGVSQGIEITVL